MFIGHYSASLIAKAVDPRVPLGVLFVATQIVDIAWSIFVMTGVEETLLVPGFTATNDFDLTYVPYTHSLAATVGWAAIALTLWRFAGTRATWRSALVVGAVVLSHWFLDLVVHTPNLPLYGTSHPLGLGLWNYPYLNLGCETALLFIALLFYLRATRAIAPGGRWQMIVLAAGMVAMQSVALLGSRPEEMTETATSALGVYLVFALLAEWFDRKRASVLSASC